MCFERIAGVLAELFGEHGYLLDGGTVASHDAQVFTAILERRASQAVCTGALGLLSRLLARHHGQKVLILIDEYDSPIHAGYASRYYDDVIAFFSDLLSGGLKDNEHLWAEGRAEAEGRARPVGGRGKAADCKPDRPVCAPPRLQSAHRRRSGEDER